MPRLNPLPRQGSSKFGYTQLSQEEVDSIGVLTDGFGDFRASQKAEDADARIAEGGQCLGSGSATNAASVFPKNHVANPMQPVFYTPMATPPTEQLPGRRLGPGHAGDRVLHFGRLLAVAPGRASDAADLRDARPREIRRQAGGRFQAAMFATTVPLVTRFGDIQASLPL